MIKRALAWVDERTGLGRFAEAFLFQNLPGGSRWRYVWGTLVLYVFFLQAVTGFFLWTAYSPSTQTAWESIHFIQHEMTGGWLLRGLHHFGAQAFVVVLVLHLLQMVIYGVYRAPREVNFWLVLALLPLAIAMSATGWLLPYDQHGFWASRVPIGIMGVTPVIGPWLQKIAMGGSTVGHHTLTHFLALHAGLLPLTVALALGGHYYLNRKHGFADVPKDCGCPDERYFPAQFLKDAAACLAVLIVLLGFVLVPVWQNPSAAPGVHLGAPADPSEQYSAARPEWFMLFLFQFLKYFPGGTEVWGAMVIPGLVMTVIALMPFVAKWKHGHRFNLLFIGALLLGALTLTRTALVEDSKDETYLTAKEHDRRSSERMRQLATERGIPPSGGAALLRDDPFTQGPKLFAKNCASCHRFDGHDATGRLPLNTYTVRAGDTWESLAEFRFTQPAQLRDLNQSRKDRALKPGEQVTVYARPWAPDLKGFASREWLTGLMDPAHVDGPRYFGGTKFKDGKMVKWVKKNCTPEKADDLKKVIAALSAEAKLKSQIGSDKTDAELIKQGRALITGDFACTDCHSFGKKDPDATAPDLTGYGSRTWLVRIISNPAHADFYGKRNDRMPAFADKQILDAKSIGLLADWLRGEWYVAPKTAAK
ncbi:MAG: menaquinol-cytochrome C reductase [Pedosphaera sp. Tous-C6FEB]|nr:MAG: menaquinol-cytochrome C reductase [Pedosphaera sp. Tous-C6FEB]